MVDTQQSRFEKSLGLLTTKFVNLLQKASGGVLDLKIVSKMLLTIGDGKIFSCCIGCGYSGCETKTKDI